MQAESKVENTAPANFDRPLRYPNVVVTSDQRFSEGYLAEFCALF